MSAREERLVTENNLWELDTWLDKVDVFAKPHFDYVNGQLVNTGIKFGNGPTRMTAFIGDTIVRHEDGSHTALSAKDAAELDKLRARVAELETQLSDLSEPDVDGAGRTYAEYHPPVPEQRQAEDPHDSVLHHDYALGRDLPAIPHQSTGRCPEGHLFEDCTCGGTR
ncbi:hypothetical protein [Nocardioides sp. NPDC006273]|uniref:hypothetical protein n=1 Tax=Actinomycetes TaxID=1760 RepID=UPI0033A31192